MNSQRVPHRFALLFVAVLAVTGVEAVALPPLGRDVEGVIASVDASAQTLRLRRSKDSESMLLIWNSRTRFVEKARFVSAEKLRAGAPVTIIYRAPFFGKPFATKVLLRSGLR